MKCINIYYRDLKNSTGDIDSVFRDLEVHKIDTVNWEQYNYLPEVSFKIFYDDESLFIKYFVREEELLALRTEVNSPVYKDSCVEFFIAPENGKYFNFEFNAIGTTYIGSGFDRKTGGTLDSTITSRIKTKSSLGNLPIPFKKGNFNWNLLVGIPLDIFTCKKGSELKGSSMRGNFYKCGDELNTPHFLTWNSIDTDNPDFHRSEFFGIINFK